MKQESLLYYENKNYYREKGVLITGAAGGIGSLLTATLVHLGARVVALVKDEKKLTDALNVYKINPKLVHVEKMDFKVDSNYREIFTKIMFHLKGKLDIMFLCHGQFAQGEIMGTILKEYDEAININTRSIMSLVSLATPFLKHTKGNIVAISSLESFIPVKNSFLNTVSKSMVNMIIQNAALELASFGVRVNGVAPGVTNTLFRKNEFQEPQEKNNSEYMNKAGMSNLLSHDVIQPDDVVDVMLFLGCDDAEFITGEIIKVDNGYSLNHDNSFGTTK
jgi:NAD(P)-dependent dehydrogenase (short-subunit alcohol dehydrogenase family)